MQVVVATINSMGMTTNAILFPTAEVIMNTCKVTLKGFQDDCAFLKVLS
jgi:hypothetical protein